MKKSRIEDILEETNSNNEVNADYVNLRTIDSEGVKIVDLTSKEDEIDETDNENKISKAVNDWYEKRKKKRKERRRGKGRLRRISAIIVCSLVISLIVISVWNAAQMKQISDIRETIDETYNTQQLNTDYVERLGNLFTIHDEKTFNWCINNIYMTEDVRSSLFTKDEDGKYTFKGQDMQGDPSYQCVELMFANDTTNALSYLAEFRVLLANGKVKYFFVTCKFREDGNKMVLTKFHVY